MCFFFFPPPPQLTRARSIEYPPGAEPVIFLKSKDCFYRLHSPNKGYKEVYRAFTRKVNLTKRVLDVMHHIPDCSIIHLAKHGRGIQLDELADHGAFIMAEFESFPDEKIKNSHLVKKELPEFLKRYQKDAARARVGQKLHEANRAIQSEQRRVEQGASLSSPTLDSLRTDPLACVLADTLDFFTKHWEVIQPFAKGLPKAILARLSSGKCATESVEQRVSAHERRRGHGVFMEEAFSSGPVHRSARILFWKPWICSPRRPPTSSSPPCASTRWMACAGWLTSTCAACEASSWPMRYFFSFFLFFFARPLSHKKRCRWDWARRCSLLR